MKTITKAEWDAMPPDEQWVIVQALLLANEFYEDHFKAEANEAEQMLEVDRRRLKRVGVKFGGSPRLLSDPCDPLYETGW